MTLDEQIKTYRKKAGMSQEKLAEKLCVSRQAITKWENGTGVPDISNIVAIAELFQVSLDTLLNKDEKEKKQSDYLYESKTEYDIDGIKNFDIKLGGANKILLQSSDGEKIEVILFSNLIKDLQKDYKIKIDDIKNRIDVEIVRLNSATEAQAKEGLMVQISIPNQYMGKIEVAVNCKTVELSGIKNEIVELDGKISELLLNDGKGEVEVNSNLDMTVWLNSYEGAVEINQISATSKIIVPETYAFRAARKGIATSIYYEKQGKSVEDFSSKDAENYIELNGLKSELIITTGIEN